MQEELVKLTTKMIEAIGMEEAAKILEKNLKFYKITYSKVKPDDQKLYFSNAYMNDFQSKQEQKGTN